MNEAAISEIEMGLFLEGLLARHGYDFRHYAKASMKRRIVALAQSEGCSDIAEMLPRLLRDEGFLQRALAHISVGVTEMFRDPDVFLGLRQKVLPLLASQPRITVWQAGCATGEESYSLAILLQEEGLLRKTQIYATDINDEALAKAEAGLYPGSVVKTCSENYARSGGTSALTDYFMSSNGCARIHADLRERVVFAHHNLVGDGVFCEVNLIMCRNVLIYFDRSLQDRVVALFSDSLARGGFLCLGSRETMQLIGSAAQFDTIDHQHRIFRKRRTAQ